jgi:hypothetical protein
VVRWRSGIRVRVTVRLPWSSGGLASCFALLCLSAAACGLWPGLSLPLCHFVLLSLYLRPLGLVRHWPLAGLYKAETHKTHRGQAAAFRVAASG